MQIKSDAEIHSWGSLRLLVSFAVQAVQIAAASGVRGRQGYYAKGGYGHALEFQTI